MLKAGILKNTSNGRFHPIVFKPSPMPGGVEATPTFMRYKSHGHHTDGFIEEKDAEIYITENKLERIDYAAEWNGEGVPTDIILLPLNG